jgi:transglycosylase-like protein with SLT domain
LASKDSKARHRREGRQAATFSWSSGGRGRHRLKHPSTGLIAMSAVLLAASATASTVQAAPLAPPAPVGPAPASADGGTAPAMDFPEVETHLASGRFVGTDIPVATGSGSIPSTVLAAYQRAVERINMVQPNCHIPLELLAAIGKVESGHARGGRVDATGRTVTPILGPVLNGGAFAAIADTDNGVLDGDTTWDRAVGPMQFIPGTWDRWASDGNLDGQLDPHNVYDASLAAARYLCAANRDLGTPAGLDEAVLSYNHSTSYLTLVRSWMAVYRNGTISVDDITDPGSDPTLALGSGGPVVTPPATPPATPPVSTPPTDPPTDPSTPPTSPPTDPSTPPTDPSTPPTTPPDTETPPPAEQPPDQPPTSDPAAECGLVDAVTGLVGGLLGESPDCVMDLELSTPETRSTDTPAAETPAATETPAP